jgi:hypothetical protein
MWFWFLVHVLSIVVSSLVAWKLCAAWNLNDFDLFIILFAVVGGLPIFVTGYLIWSSEYLPKYDEWRRWDDPE